MTEIMKQLKTLQDQKYRDFQAALLPDLPKETILGVRMPELRHLAKTLKNTEEAEQFLHTLPHATYDENNLHAFLINQKCKDYDTALRYVNEFLPYVNNWATCDSFTVKALLQDKMKLKQQCLVWMESDHPYTLRYAIVLQLKYFMKEDFDPELMKTAAQIHSDHYYVKMAQAWYLSMALIEHQKVTADYLALGQCDCWVCNKALQKACESRKCTPAQKEQFKKLKREK